MHVTPFDQQTYQVRFEWGVDGFARVAASEIVVVVDVLPFSATATAMDAAGAGVGAAAASVGVSPATASAGVSAASAVSSAAAGAGSMVMRGSLRNAAAVAQAVRTEQQRRGVRTSVVVIAAGEWASQHSGAPLRFAVEDQLGAGAIIEALTTVGIDHTSPEAAVAAEGFRALRGAIKHMLTASGSGRALAALGRSDEVASAAAVDAASTVPVLRDGRFVAYE